MMFVICTTEEMSPRLSALARMGTASYGNTVVWHDGVDDLLSWEVATPPEECVRGATAYFRITETPYTDAEVQERCTRLYSTYLKRFNALSELPEDTVVAVWGSASIIARCAIFAAEAAGISNILCLESPLLPQREPRTSWMVSLNRAYYELGSGIPIDVEDPDADVDWAQAYGIWWRDTRSTKPTHQDAVDADVELPVALIKADRSLVAFGQLKRDAARIGVPDDAVAVMMDALARWGVGGFYKPHPFDPDPPPTYVSVLPKTLDIHRVLAHTYEVLTVNSNVGLEAFFYGCIVRTYGDAIYTPVQRADHEVKMAWISLLYKHHHLDSSQDLSTFVERLASAKRRCENVSTA